MIEEEPQFLELGEGGKRRRIAFRWSRGTREGPALLWLPGFLSDMASTKAIAVAAWGVAQGFPVMRFDYSAHGQSGGDILHATIGDWLEEAIAIFDSMADAPRIVIGSSMGGWIALLLARHLAERGESRKLAGLVLIAPAFDMTEALIWANLSPEARAEIERSGVIYVPSNYDDPYPITRTLIEEGRSHLIAPFDPGCRVRILQGMRDADVPWRHALALAERLTTSDVELTLVKDGDHRLSRPEDLHRLTATIAALVAPPD